MVIEEDIDDGAKNRGIRPLPNLDFKFVTANSLLGLPESGTNVVLPAGSLSLFDDASHIDRLKEIRNHYFIADTEERSRLRDEFKDLQLSMVRRARDSRGATSDLYNTLSDWNPFKHDKTEWFDSEWMFGIQSFDIVIANPPYVGEKGNKAIFEALKPSSLGKRFYKGKMDLFYFFFHLGLDCLKDGGVLTFITTNYYPTADGAVKLRKDFYERTNIARLINFGEITVFDSARGQHNLITILQRANTPSVDYKTEEIVASSKGSVSSGALIDVLSGESNLVARSEVKKQAVYDSVGVNFYIRFAGGVSGIDEILDKIKTGASLLSDVAKVSVGLRSGIDKISKSHNNKYDFDFAIGDGVYIVDNNFYDSTPENERVILKPLYKNSDISRWATNSKTNKYVIYSSSKTVIDSYPYIKNHLSKYRDLIEKIRTNDGEPWFSLVRPREEKTFNEEKIVVSQRSLHNNFAYNDFPFYGSSDIYYIKESNSDFPIFYLLGVLNSKIMYTWLYHRGKRKGQMLELYRTPLSEIPIASGTTNQKQAVEKFVREIIDFKTADPTADVSAQEADINQLVYKLYNLTPEEISIIESEEL